MMSIAFIDSPMALARDHRQITSESVSDIAFTLIENSIPVSIYVDTAEDKGVKIAADNLSEDFKKVSGNSAKILSNPTDSSMIIIATEGSPVLKSLVKSGKFDDSDLKGKNEKYVITNIENPFPGIKDGLLIAGSDRRGTIYGIYELSEQIGVSPWYDWADVPTEHHTHLTINNGRYTAGEPSVKYRGIFLNDEAPCLTSWVKNTYGTDYGDHEFYSRVFELILRLRGNFIWPAMWGWAFYADDPQNSKTADEMGIIVGTSHHEPMARNHQEYARHRNDYGAWNYATNKTNLDRFFSFGIERMKDTEDVVTIGMRGDGDEAMSADADVELLKDIISNQRNIIKKVTGQPASKTPQVWALYKEVLDYYDAGLKVPDDVILLLCDDNWGNVRRLPNADERNHPGGWGMYYHVDYVGAPRNTKWINVTPIQNMWEQLALTYNYGVDKLWILNVGDLKPMEYPIDFFLKMAWNPDQYEENGPLDHTYNFCLSQFGKDNAGEAARILNLYCKYAGRVTPEMLDKYTYNLHTGEWKDVADDFVRLEAEAMRQYIDLPQEYKDTYYQLILFPIQALSNLYDMYYSQAMNAYLYQCGDPDANKWADRVAECFNRDRKLCDYYNHVLSGGKWNGFMTQKHIGYTSWHDGFDETEPSTFRFDNPGSLTGMYIFEPTDGAVIMEAEHYYNCKADNDMEWTVIPFTGRTKSGVTLTPNTIIPKNATIDYRMKLPEGQEEVTVHLIVKSVLDFQNTGGHNVKIYFNNHGAPETDSGYSGLINLNSELNEKPENIYSVFYPTVARRVIEKKIKLQVPPTSDGLHTLTLQPLDPGIVIEKIVVDCGGYSPSYLFGNESSYSRKE